MEEMKNIQQEYVGEISTPRTRDEIKMKVSKAIDNAVSGLPKKEVDRLGLNIPVKVEVQVDQCSIHITTVPLLFRF